MYAIVKEVKVGEMLPDKNGNQISFASGMMEFMGERVKIKPLPDKGDDWFIGTEQDRRWWWHRSWLEIEGDSDSVIKIIPLKVKLDA